MNTLLVEAEALFGSSARQDHDEVSDRDYLIVDDDKARLRARKARLAAQGFSVADYTWQRLGRLVKSQALFAIHLKNEARVLHDQFGRLSRLLKSAQPKASYSADFMASLALFRPLADIPEGEHGLAWAADVAAVAFRNSAILRLANEGHFVFGHAYLWQFIHRRAEIERQIRRIAEAHNLEAAAAA